MCQGQVCFYIQVIIILEVDVLVHLEKQLDALASHTFSHNAISEKSLSQISGLENSLKQCYVNVDWPQSNLEN